MTLCPTPTTPLRFPQFLGLRSMSLRLQPQATVSALLQLGVSRDPRELTQSGGEFPRCVWCSVVGGKGVGKSSLVRRLVGGAAPGVGCVSEGSTEELRFVVVGVGGRCEVGDGGRAGGGERRGGWGNPGGAK